MTVPLGTVGVCHGERISVSMVRTTTAPGPATGRSVIPQALGVVGCLAVTAIHIIDQGGVPGLKEPEYIRVLYYVLEAAGVVAATLLLTRYGKSGWFLALGVAAGPILGYVLSRGPGLPNYDDIGNWTEPLGVISLVVEGILLIIAAAVLATARRST
jgi:hypothetical protein